MPSLVSMTRDVRCHVTCPPRFGAEVTLIGLGGAKYLPSPTVREAATGLWTPHYVTGSARWTRGLWGRDDELWLAHQISSQNVIN